jgi:hypothetical protein
MWKKCNEMHEKYPDPSACTFENICQKLLETGSWNPKTCELSKSVMNKANEVAVVALGGLVVSVLATGPKVRGFKPGRGRWILRVIKSAARLPSEGK